MTLSICGSKSKIHYQHDYSSFSIGQSAICAIRSNDKTIDCNGYYQEFTPLNEKFSKVSSGYHSTCAITTEQEIICFSDDIKVPYIT